ncbi:hypothetical protein BRADI_4g10363v3 [Brachypodium distachyon]|uniref:Uncharacterized protein n=1 Tax=Brachypodium distachyon TaxID=15368 RepID=A0A2K2CLU1_BRADI|nr:hypothetical protein BRADI_4g10363v3 [Brachypodium distachyon]
MVVRFHVSVAADSPAGGQRPKALPILAARKQALVLRSNAKPAIASNGSSLQAGTHCAPPDLHPAAPRALGGVFSLEGTHASNSTRYERKVSLAGTRRLYPSATRRERTLPGQVIKYGSLVGTQRLHERKVFAEMLGSIRPGFVSLLIAYVTSDGV